MKFFTFLFVTVLLVSCADLKKGEQVETINGMIKSVDSISTVLIENDIVEIVTLARESATVEKRIQENFDSDTIDLEFAKKMEAFKRMLNAFPILKEMYTELKIDTKGEKKTLVKLKNDIEHGNGNRSKYAEYVSFEQQKVKQLCSVLADYTNLKKEAVSTFQKLHTEINEYSLTLLPE